MCSAGSFAHRGRIPQIDESEWGQLALTDLFYAGVLIAAEVLTLMRSGLTLADGAAAGSAQVALDSVRVGQRLPVLDRVQPRGFGPLP
jgi:hypothetical protein